MGTGSQLLPVGVKNKSNPWAAVSEMGLGCESGWAAEVGSVWSHLNPVGILLWGLGFGGAQEVWGGHNTQGISGWGGFAFFMANPKISEWFLVGMEF